MQEYNSLTYFAKFKCPRQSKASNILAEQIGERNKHKKEKTIEGEAKSK